VKATEVTAGMAESNGSLLPGLWRDSLHVTCGLTACTPGSAPGPVPGNVYGKTLPFFIEHRLVSDTDRQTQYPRWHGVAWVKLIAADVGVDVCEWRGAATTRTARSLP